MSDNSWVLRGVDAETRQRAEQEAARRGVSLADYLTDVVLQMALTEQLGTPAAQEAEPDQQIQAGETAAGAEQADFAVRHRLQALERRLGLAVGGLDSAFHALDSSMFGLAARVDEAEVLAADTADLLNQALQDNAAQLGALRKRLGDAEDQTGVLAEAQEALGQRCDGLAQHLAAVDEAARTANASAEQLAAAHEALKFAVAEDFSAFAGETAQRLSDGLDEVRAAADAAAEQADAAVAHLVNELRAVREAVEERLNDSVAETRARVQSAFADAAERMNGLGERVNECERLTTQTAEQLRAQIADVEDAAQTAIEETAETLRQAGAALASECARAARDNRTALESVHSDLSGEIADLRERQGAGLARLKLIDTVVTNALGEVASLRESAETRAAQGEAAVRAVLAQAQADWDARHNAATARLEKLERENAEAHMALHAETERVESCVFAALEKLGGDRAEGDAALARRIDALRDQGSDALARLAEVDQTVGRQAERLAQLEAHVATTASAVADQIERLETELSLRAIDCAFDERLLRLEAAAEKDDTAHALAAVRGQLGALAAKVDARDNDTALAQRLEEFNARLFASEAQAGESADRIHGMARLLSRLSAQNAGAEAVQALERRVGELEQKQREAIERLHADIAHFIGENERRLETLEQAPTSDGDIGAEFEALRRRIEERVLGVEQRSVRALEQVADTMAVLEERFLAGAEAAARSA